MWLRSRRTKSIGRERKADEIRKLAQDGLSEGMVQRVGALYEKLEDLFSDNNGLRDDDFRTTTFPFQANWDEWGRGYQAGARGNVIEAIQSQLGWLLPQGCRSAGVSARESKHCACPERLGGASRGDGAR